MYTHFITRGLDVSVGCLTDIATTTTFDEVKLVAYPGIFYGGWGGVSQNTKILYCAPLGKTVLSRKYILVTALDQYYVMLPTLSVYLVRLSLSNFTAARRRTDGVSLLYSIKRKYMYSKTD